MFLLLLLTIGYKILQKKYNNQEDEILLEDYGLIDSSGLIYQSGNQSDDASSDIQAQLKQMQRHYKELQEKFNNLMTHVEVLEHENNDLHQQVLALEKLKHREQSLKTRIKELTSELDNFKQKNVEEVQMARNQNKKLNQEKINNLELELKQVKKNLEEAQYQIELQNKKNEQIAKEKQKINDQLESLPPPITTTVPTTTTTTTVTTTTTKNVPVVNIQPGAAQPGIKECIIIEDYSPGAKKKKQL